MIFNEKKGIYLMITNYDLDIIRYTHKFIIYNSCYQRSKFIPVKIQFFIIFTYNLRHAVFKLCFCIHWNSVFQ